jgi:hypothetical protein
MLLDIGVARWQLNGLGVGLSTLYPCIKYIVRGLTFSVGQGGRVRRGERANGVLFGFPITVCAHRAKNHI